VAYLLEEFRNMIGIKNDQLVEIHYGLGNGHYGRKE
jgi:hypothetical protein